MTSHLHSPDPADGHRPHRRAFRRRALLAGLAIGLASAGAGAVAGAAALPSVEEMRRISAEEVGVDPDLLDLPLVAPIVDAMTERVEDRLMDEARRSVAVAVGASAAVAVAGVAVVLVAGALGLGDHLAGHLHVGGVLVVGCRRSVSHRNTIPPYPIVVNGVEALAGAGTGPVRCEGRPRGQASVTVSVPSMPASRWPGTEQ